MSYTIALCFSRGGLCALSGMLWLAAAHPVHGDIANPTELIPLSRLADDFFGAAVSIDGVRAIVTADRDDTNGANAGIAYEFDVSSLDGDPTRLAERNVSPSGAAAQADFGSSASISGDLAIIGASKAAVGAVSDAGAAYVFNLASMTQQSKLVSPTPVALSKFGLSVAIDKGGGNSAIVGAPGVAGGSRSEGAAYLFDDLTTCNNQSNCVGSPLDRTGINLDQEDKFGFSVAMSQQFIVVGAPGPPVRTDPNFPAAKEGIVYVYDRMDMDTAMDFTLSPDGSDAGDAFGFSVDVSGNWAIVGAPVGDRSESGGTINNTGAAYLFDLQRCVAEANAQCAPDAVLSAPEGEPLDLFGAAVAIDGNWVVIGAPLAQHQPESESDFGGGVVYLYDVSDPSSPMATLTAGEKANVNDAYGVSVSISGDNVVVGASQNDEACVVNEIITDLTCDSGAAFITHLQELLAGDAEQDLDFDQFDLIQVQIANRYLTGQPATWGEGDWNGAPGGLVGSPPAGDGLFNQFDIIAAQQADIYLTGPYAAHQDSADDSPGEVSVTYVPETGEVTVQTNDELSSINISSSAGVFTADSSAELIGAFDIDSDHDIFKATFGAAFGSVNFGRIAKTGLSEQFLLQDLAIQGTFANGQLLDDVEVLVVPIPEPGALCLSLCALAGIAVLLRRHARLACRRTRRARIATAGSLLLSLLCLPQVARAIDPDDLNNVNLDSMAIYDHQCEQGLSCILDDRFEEQFFLNFVWKLRIDPLLVESILVDVVFPPDRAEFIGFRPVDNYKQEGLPPVIGVRPDQMAVLQDLRVGIPPSALPRFTANQESVDAVVLLFRDLQPTLDPQNVEFTVMPEEVTVVNTDDPNNIVRNVVRSFPEQRIVAEPLPPIFSFGRRDDEKLSLVYNSSTGELEVDVPPFRTLSAINIDSEAGIFTQQPALNLGGVFDVDEDDTIFKTVFDDAGFGSVSFGPVAQPGLNLQFLLSDLTPVASQQSPTRGPAGRFDLIVENPEPATALSLVFGILTTIMFRWKPSCVIELIRRP